MSFLMSNDKFIMSMIITGCIALAGCAGTLVFTGNSSASAKWSFLYMIFYIFIHEISTLLAFYTTSPDLVRVLIIIKSSSAYLIKTSLLLFAGFYSGKQWIKRLSVGIHLVSLCQIMPLLLIEGFADTIILFNLPLKAEYQNAALWYLVMPGMLCILLSIIMMFSTKPFRQKPVANSIFFGILLLCIAALSLHYVSTQDLIWDKMHLIIFLGVLAANFRSMPFIDGHNKFTFRSSILDGFSEAVVIYDRKDRVIHMHDGLKSIKISRRLEDINGRLRDTGAFNGVLEGRITLKNGHPVHLQYRISTLQSENKVFGKIIHFRDVTEMVSLQLQLADKNRQLELAFERKHQMMKAASQLAVENERARILDKVNKTANAYINRVRRDVAQLESETVSGTELQQKVRMKNDQLLEVTRNVIETIRSTVKKLNLEPAALATYKDRSEIRKGRRLV